MNTTAVILDVNPERLVSKLIDTCNVRFRENWLSYVKDNAPKDTIEVFGGFFIGNRYWELCYTQYVRPHIDGLAHRYSLGIVIVGNHELVTGRSNVTVVGRLKQNTAFVLNSNEFYGFRRKSRSVPLIYMNCSFNTASLQDTIEIAKTIMELA